MKRWYSRGAAMLAAVLLGLAAVESAFAITPTPIPEPGPDPDPFVPWPNGFDWSMQDRFGPLRADGLVDFHWNEATHTYDDAYVHPTSFRVKYDGCASQADEDAIGNLARQHTYVWSLPGAISAPPLNHTCKFTATYPTQGAFTATLDVTPSVNGKTHFSQTVVIKDFVIVSLGDSYASGEGNPDIEGSSPTWEDKRCHRSSKAGPAQAALAFERADPKTSVTFLSFACSGATINRLTFKDDDATKPQGSGILAPYRGAEFSGGFTPAERLPSQIDAVASALNGRPIDALLISGGGNDIGFANVATACVLASDCFTDSEVWFDFNPASALKAQLSTVVSRQASFLPGRLDALAAAIHDPAPVGRPALNVSKVFITEYPDPTKTDNGAFCPAILDDTVVFWGSMSLAEEQAAITAVMNPLNGAVQAVAQRNAFRGWQFVSGIAARFAGPGVGHGYCAANRFIRRNSESGSVQGNGDATLHPNGAGQLVVRDQVRDALLAAVH